MSKQLTAVALLALVAGTAMAAPRESRTNAGPVNVWGASAAPESFTMNFTGVDGTPYTATHVQVQGTLTSNVAGSWPNDASMDIMAPDGTTVTAVLSQTTGGYTSELIDVTRPIILTGSMAGDWTFTPYETYEDSIDGSPDSILTDITVTMDDTPGAPNGSAATAIDLGALVDGTNVSVTAAVGAAEVLWYKFTCLDVTSAAGRKLSMGTLNSGGGDSEIAVYDSTGTGLYANDDYTGLLSFMSFGVNGTTGADLPAGDYYIPVASFPTTFYIADFNVVSDGDGGTFQLDVLQEFVGAPVAPDAEDLGTLVDGTHVTRDITLAGSEVKWYKCVTAEASAATGRQLSVSTLDTVNATDTEIGMYTDTGTLLGNNDDNPYPRSYMAFGFNGTFGDAPAGLKYIAVSTFNATFLPSWNVTSTGAGGDVHVDVIQLNSFSPVGVAAIAASGNGQLLTIGVTGGTNPDSTGITVSADLSGLGGSATAALNDSGNNGDVTAGDGVYSLQIANPSGGSDGQAYTINWTVADAQSRSDTGTVAFSIDSNNSLATAEVPSGTGTLDSISGNFDYEADVDMYKISICDPGSFSATTANGTTSDTQLFLFDSNGMGVTSDDDLANGIGGVSTVTGMFVTGSGDYYIAVSRYDVDPVDSTGQQIWADTPFDAERQPDGPGAGNPLAGWAGAAFGTIDYTISFTGTCYSSNTSQCSVADVGIAGGLPGHDHLLNNNDFIAFITLFFASDPQADMGMAGGLPGSDGQWNNNDFIAFIGHFFDDAAHCNG